MTERRRSKHYGGGLTDEESCPYLPDRMWRNLIFDFGDNLDADTHEMLLNHGYRRMARTMFRPMCAACDECRPLRIDVRGFTPTRSQRRAYRRNADVEVSTCAAAFSEERRELLHRYLTSRHVGPMTAEPDVVRACMYDAPPETLCFDYRVNGRLVASGLVDTLKDVTSSVYFFFDPEEKRRSLGIFSMLVEIEHAKLLGHRWHHPGFFVAACPAMNYKKNFAPAELLRPDGTWVPLVVGD